MKVDNPFITIQGSDQWHEFRKTHIGASEIAAVLGCSPYMTARELWLLKTGQAEPKPMNAGMQFGKEREAAIISEFEKRTGFFTLSCIYEHDDFPFLSASLDGITQDGKTIVEIKFCNKEVFEMAQDGKVVEHYYLQIQQQLLLSYAEKAYFFCYNPSHDDYVSVEVLPDKKAQSRIVEEGAAFWKKVTEMAEPELSEKDLLVVEELDFNVFEQDLADIQAQIKHLGIREAELKKALIQYRDTALEGKNCRGKHYSVISRIRTSYDYKKACVDNFIILDTYKKQSSYTEIRRKK